MDILTFLYVIDTFLTFLTRCIGYNKIDIIQHIMVRNWAKGTVHIRWHRDNFRDYNYIEKQACFKMKGNSTWIFFALMTLLL